MDLTVDIGNSNIKLGLFNADKLISLFTVSSISHQRLLHYALKRNVKNIIVSSVRGQSSQLFTPRIKKFFTNFLELNPSLAIPIKINYETKETLGQDRIAAAAGASHIFPEKNILVIDMGSAITFDMVTKDNEFIGGNISPGLNMRFKALHQFTSQLPLCQHSVQHGLFGKNTREAIISGVQNGIIFETEKYIENVKSRFSHSEIIITGGNSKFFDNKLKYTIFAEPNLITLGLYKILKFNIYDY
jgi:type III pantothenate kinase